MKKTVCLILTILCVVCSPLAVWAQSYEVKGTAMTVNLDESVWYVFTRDNLAGNPELEELGLDYAEMVDSMMNDDIYIYACLYFYSGSYVALYVQKWQQEFYWNSADYSDSEILEIGKNTYEGIATDDNTSVYENPYNHYKFFVLEYAEGEETVLQYETDIDSTTYFFQFWTDGPYTEEKREIVKGIMDGVQYQPEVSSEEEKDSGLPEWLALIVDLKWVWVAIAAVTALILIVGVRMERKKSDTAEPTNADAENEHTPEESAEQEDTDLSE